MKGITIILLILAVSPTLLAQKTIEKQWDALEIDTLMIESDVAYSIRILSTTSEQIVLSAKVEGEYYESVVINSLQKGRSLTLETGFSPYFSRDNDKLAAHKVLAIEMIFHVPEKIAVLVRSRSSSVLAKGKRDYLETILAEGTTHLAGFTGDARLFSKKGDILVEAGVNVGARANSSHGSVENSLPLEGDYFIEATSVYGDVTLRNRNK